MERSREARRSSMASANGLSRRRQRSTSLRESHDVQMELQDTVRFRDRANKRDRDREFSNHHKIQNKRRRGDSVTVGEEDSTEESVADEEDFEFEERRVAHTISHNTTSFSSSALSQSSRKNLPPIGLVKQAPAFKAADELIGVLVPRKTRSSASVKRSHESWQSGNGGFCEDQKASSTSPASLSAEANSPQSWNVSVRKKMKPNGPKTRLPKVVKCSSSSVQQEDIEIEIAEVLFGLLKQSQNSEEEDGENIRKLESKDAKGISQDAKLSVSVLPQNTSRTSDLLPDGAATKKKKVEADKSSNLAVVNGLVSSSVQIESKMEASAPKLEKTASHELDASKVASMTVEPLEEVTKQGDSELAIEGSVSPDDPVTEKKSISAKEESATCLRMDVDFQDSTVTKATSIALENESRKEEKFKIDLMAPPPMASSPERDGFIGFTSDPSWEANEVIMKALVKDAVKTHTFLTKEPVVEEVEEKKIEAIGDRQLKIQDNGKDSSVKLQLQSQKQQQLQSKDTAAKVEITEAESESSSVPLKISVAGWPIGLHPLGYMPPFQTMTPMDGSSRSATAQQTPPFTFSQPRPRRCTTHSYIARNIYSNQQVAKMNPFCPAGAGSAALHGAKPNNPNAMPSTENIIHGNPVQGSFQLLNLNSGQDKGQAVASFLHPAQKGKRSEGIDFMDPAQKKQLVHQQASAGNLLGAPAFVFPVSQQQVEVTAGTNQPGPSKSAATSTKSASISFNSTAALPASSAALPAAAMSYNFPNLAGNETPYLTILQNNGYPFLVPTPIGSAPAIRGGTQAQALPFFNGSFYSSQIFHPSQLQHQQQPHLQPLMQATHQNTSTSSASSSSHKQLHFQQPRGVPVGGNNFVSMQSQQTEKQHVSSSNQSRKLEAEMSGENTSSVANSKLTNNQAVVSGQNFSVPFQPLNFALIPSAAVGGGSAGGAHSEKQQQQQSQLKSFKGGVEFIPQAFASFSGSNSPSNLNFSSLQHNPAIFQSLPDMARQGYQVVPASQVASHNKNHQTTEVKTGGGSSNHNEGKKPGLGKSSITNAQKLVFDDSAITLNFGSSPITGNWPSRSSASTAVTSNGHIAASSQNFKQQHQFQLQNQQTLQQHQQAAAAAARSKAQTTNSLPSASIAAKLSNNATIFSQAAQWNNSASIPSNQGPSTSLTSSSTSNIKNVSQQQGRYPQGHTQISFERHSKSSLAPQGQQLPASNQSKPSSSGSKAGSSIPTLQAQQTENSSASTGQKSSPVCGRNVPSIVSTCPSHLSELKY